MKRRLEYLPEAEAALDRLLLAWAEQGTPSAAWRRFTALHERCEILTEYPMLGRAHVELAPSDRMFSFDRQITVVYRVEPSAVVIVDIFVRGQDPFGHDPVDDGN